MGSVKSEWRTGGIGLAAIALVACGFRGRIDEFALLAHALTADETHRVHGIGRADAPEPAAAKQPRIFPHILYKMNPSPLPGALAFLALLASPVSAQVAVPVGARTARNPTSTSSPATCAGARR